MKIEVTMEKTMRVAKVFDATEAQLQALRDGINPFQKDLEADLENGGVEYDYAVDDEEGRTIVPWD